MNPGRYDITLRAGSTFDLPINYADDAGVPVDLSTYTARMQVRESPASGLICEFSSNIGAGTGWILMNGLAEDREDGLGGNLRLFMTAANSAALGACVAQYDLELSDSTQYVTKILSGRFTIVSEITR